MFESLAIALDSLLIGGMAVFGAKYLEIQFGIDASSSGTYFGEKNKVKNQGRTSSGGAWVQTKKVFP